MDPLRLPDYQRMFELAVEVVNRLPHGSAWDTVVGAELHTVTAGAAAGLGITRRELAVLRLLAEGITAQAIARRLRIRTGTVSKHQQSLYRELGGADRLSAVLLARDRGVLPHRWHGGTAT